MGRGFMSELTRFWGICKLEFDDFVRTGSMPMLRALIRFLESFFTKDPDVKLRAAAGYLMHRTSSVLSGLARRRAYTFAELAMTRNVTSSEATIIRSAVIKPYVSENEPGIILVKFESQLNRIINLKRFDELQQHYRICFLPSWQNFLSPEIFKLDVGARSRYYVLPSDFSEVDLRPFLGPHCRILPFHAASWVNEALYAGDGIEKDIDIVMLANFHNFKRHWKLFKALPDLPADLNIRFLGVPLGGRTRDDLDAEADLFGVAGRYEILEDADQQTIRGTLKRSRLMCALSHREGSYVGVAEALMAGTPVGMFANAMIGTKAYINEETGFLFDPRLSLAKQISDALANVDSLSPRQWAIENISSRENCRRLNEQLRQDYLESGLVWTEDVRAFYCVRMEFFFDVDHGCGAGGMSADYERLAHEFGLVFTRPTHFPV